MERSQKSHKWLNEALKSLIRSSASTSKQKRYQRRQRRCHKRKLFFASIFERLRESEMRADIGSFSGIKGDDSWFDNACHDMAGFYDFYSFDKTYDIDAGKFFSSDDKHPQTYKSLKVTIERKSTILRMILLRNGIYNISVDGDESDSQFNFSYEVLYSFKKSSTLQW